MGFLPFSELPPFWTFSQQKHFVFFWKSSVFGETFGFPLQLIEAISLWERKQKDGRIDAKPFIFLLHFPKLNVGVQEGVKILKQMSYKCRYTRNINTYTNTGTQIPIWCSFWYKCRWKYVQTVNFVSVKDPPSSSSFDQLFSHLSWIDWNKKIKNKK